MANITNIGLPARLWSDASHHGIRYRGGKVRQSGRGLAFWFRPDVSIIVELPIDDRETTIFAKGRSADFRAGTDRFDASASSRYGRRNDCPAFPRKDT